MLAKILVEHGQCYAKDRILDPAQPFTVEATIDMGMTADIAFWVRDRSNTVVETKGVPTPINSGKFENNVVEQSFDDLSKLKNLWYITWTIWGIYSGVPITTAGQFKVTVNVTQGGKTFTSYRVVELAPGLRYHAVPPDGLWIGAA